MGLALRLAMFLLLIHLGLTGVAPTSAQPLLSDEDLAGYARRVVELTNQERLRAGLLPLKWSDSLAASALAHAQDMAARAYFAHNSPEGSTPTDRARRAGYPAYGWGGLYVGENLAKGYPTPEGAVQGWMASEGHRLNLLNPKYREIGVAVVVAPNGVRICAQEFGSSPGSLHVFINGDAPSTDSPRVDLMVGSEDVSNWGSVGPATEMMVSNSPNFEGAAWEPYSSRREWTLRGEPGAQRVYVRLRDALGTVVECSDDIYVSGRQALALPVASGVDARIVSVWPRNGLPVAEAETVNVTARLFARGTGDSVRADFPARVLLLRSMNQGPAEVVAAGQKRVLMEGLDEVPVWDFNGVDVSGVSDPANSYRFQVDVEGVDTESSTWDHRQ